MTKYPIVLLFLALLAGPGAARAQSGDLEALSREYFSVLQAEGMDSVGRFIHPDALAEFKSMLLPIYEFEARSGQREFADATFGPSVPLSEIRDMNPEGFMNGVMGILVRQVESLNIVFDRIEILGIVQEGEARHVLTRITVGADPIEVTQFEVLSYLPYGDSWRLQLNGKLRGIAQALRAGMTNQ